MPRNRAGSLADVLFPKTKQRVFTLLFGRDDAEYSLNELVKLSSGGWGAVHREVSQLLRTGLLQERKLGNQRRVRANRDSPVYDEVRALVTKILGAPDILRQALAPIADQIQMAFIFGSVAKRTDRSDSDIDFFVVGTIQYAELLERVAAAESELGRHVSVRFYTPEEFARLVNDADPFIEAVLRGPRLAVLGDGSSEPG